MITLLKVLFPCVLLLLLFNNSMVSLVVTFPAAETVYQTFSRPE
ncbi:membrane or secreted protein [gut metagenome]|uniref:Membrane or secreted protein n=1 Tax=gut metagenome TaxID=749906 RepID=J9GB42_9ZZZZ